MSYYFSRQVEDNFDEVERRAREALKKEGFGVLTEIDVKETLKKKLDVEFRRYKILGAYDAWKLDGSQTLQLADHISFALRVPHGTDGDTTPVVL